jgi:nicotinic acid mononucleotide adenylyltransferase
MIRKRIREKRPIDGLVVPSVVDYIRNKGLYGTIEHV